MNVYLGIVCIIICTLLGYFYSNKYCLRTKFFSELSSFNNTYLSEVFFSKNTIDSLIKSQEKKTDFYEYIRSFFIDKKDEACNCYYLKKEEKNLIYEYVKKLGKGDSKIETDNCNYYRVKFLDFLNVAEKEEKKYRTLFIKLGFFVGMIFFVIFI